MILASLLAIRYTLLASSKIEIKRPPECNSTMSFENAADEAVAKAVQKGDVQAFAELVNRYEAKLSRYIRRFLATHADTQDALQNVFINTYTNIQGFDTNKKFSSWIYRIAHNECINMMKKNTRLPTFSLFEFDTLLPHPAARETADGPAQQQEMRELTEKMLAGIDPKYREVLVLYYNQDLSYKEIADILKIPIATVGVRLKRGKAQAQKILKTP